MLAFSFGGQRYQRVALTVLAYERTPVGEYFDDNWLSAHVSVAAGAFTGDFSCAIQAADLVEFKSVLEEVCASLRGQAQFHTMEQQLALTLVGNGLGGFGLNGLVLDQPGIGNRLTFTLDIDQTQVGSAVTQLTAAIAAFPVRAA